jgi:hypothetical protein
MGVKGRKKYMQVLAGWLGGTLESGHIEIGKGRVNQDGLV